MITKVATILYRNNKKQVPGALVTESVDIAALNEVIAGDKILIKSIYKYSGRIWATAPARGEVNHIAKHKAALSNERLDHG